MSLPSIQRLHTLLTGGPENVSLYDIILDATHSGLQIKSVASCKYFKSLEAIVVFSPQTLQVLVGTPSLPLELFFL